MIMYISQKKKKNIRYFPAPAYDLEVKVTDLEIYVKLLRQSFENLLISNSLHGFTLYLAWL